MNYFRYHIDWGVLLIDQYKWKNRILIGFGSSTLVEIQRMILEEVIPDIVDRDMVLLGFGRDDLPFRDIPIDELSSKLSVPENSIVLIGKDGSVKAKWEDPVDPQIIFDIIDAMPIRRREIQKRRG